MLVILVLAIVLFFAARYAASRADLRRSYATIAGAAAVVCFALGLITYRIVHSDPTPAPVAVAPVETAPPPPVAGTPPATKQLASTSDMPASAIAALTLQKGVTAVAAIDALTFTAAGGQPPTGNAFPSGSPIFIFGWAGTGARKPLNAIVIAVDGKPRFVGRAGYGGTRADVATFFKTSDMTHSGFASIGFSTVGLKKGGHTLQVGGLTADRKHYFLSPAAVHFTLQ